MDSAHVIEPHSSSSDHASPACFVASTSSTSTPTASLNDPTLDTPLLTPVEFDINPELTAEQRQLVLNMLLTRRNAFAASPIAPPPPTLGVTHEIHLNGGAPVKQAPYKQSPLKQEFIRSNVEMLLRHGLIRPSNSPHSSPIVIVPKPNGEMRMCIDFRRLNANTKKDAYPMPLIEDCLAMCTDATWLTIIDVQDAYYHILMDEDSKQCTAFVTADGLFEWNVMAFGLCNAPATFQRHVDTILREFIGKTCAAFFDDIVVFTKGTLEQHIEDVSKILDKLATSHLSGKVKKCKFAYKEILFVGHIIREGKLYPDPNKVAAVRDAPAPTNLVELQSFLGLANYYRKFVNGFAAIAAPLNQLTKKDVPYVWSDAQQTAFDELKIALISAPCLHGPNFRLPFILQTDASGVGLGAVLVQSVNNIEHPLAFISRQLNTAERNYSASETECLAVVWAVNQFEHFLIDAPFTIVTDHIALVWLPTKKFGNARLLRWALCLEKFKYRVVHRKGRNNVNADWLSRHPLVDTAPPEPLDTHPFFPPTPVLTTLIAHLPFPLYVFPHMPEDTRSHVVSVNSVSITKQWGHPIRVYTSRINNDNAHVDEKDNFDEEDIIDHSNDTTAMDIDSPTHTPIELDTESQQSALKFSEQQLAFQFVDTNQLEQIITAQHTDDDLPAIISFLSLHEYDEKLSPRELAAFKRKCSRYRLDTTTDPSSLYFEPYQPRQGPYSKIPMTPHLVIPKKFHNAMLELYHTSPFGGHLGVHRTHRKLAILYYWETMLDDCIKYVRHCEPCQLEKRRLNDPTQRHLRMIDPTEPFSVMSMDFIGPFPTSNDMKYVLTFIDHFTQWAIAIPCQNTSAVTSASIFVNEVVCRYGCPRTLLSDNGSSFDNAMFKQVCKFARTKKVFSTPYHPQSNGRVERFNGTIKQILRTLCGAYPETWSLMLQSATFAYNTSMSESTHMSPFAALYGREPRLPFTPTSATEESAGDEPSEEYARLLKFNLDAAAQWINAANDLKRLEVVERNMKVTQIPVYSVGDLVFIRNPVTINRKKNMGHAPIWKSTPYRVLSRYNDVVYELRAYNPIKQSVYGKTIRLNKVNLKPYHALNADPQHTPPSQPIASAPFNTPNTSSDDSLTSHNPSLDSIQNNRAHRRSARHHASSRASDVEQSENEPTNVEVADQLNDDLHTSADAPTSTSTPSSSSPAPSTFKHHHPHRSTFRPNYNEAITSTAPTDAHIRMYSDPLLRNRSTNSSGSKESSHIIADDDSEAT